VIQVDDFRVQQELMFEMAHPAIIRARIRSEPWRRVAPDAQQRDWGLQHPPA
jgi:hypothetical protein